MVREITLFLPKRFIFFNKNQREFFYDYICVPIYNEILMRNLVIFDLDGTLLYTLEDLTDSVNYTLSTFGYETKTLDEVSMHVGNGVQHLVKKLLPEDLSDSDFEKCYQCFKEHYSEHCCDKTRPYDGIMDTLKILKYRGVKVGVLSNKFQSAAEEVCEHYFQGLYDIVIGESENCRRKPAPDGINMICEKFAAEKDDVLYFGDSEVDIKTAENSGVYCVSVLWGYRDREFLADNGAKVFVSNPLDIADILD